MLRLLTVVLLLAPPGGAQEAQVAEALKRAVTYLHGTIACRGGYLWWYSEDLTQRAGEGDPVPATTIWVQTPGTPRVGEALLRCYEATGDRFYLDCATDAGRALAWGQLASGGWDYRIDFEEAAARRRHYRRDVEAGDTVTGQRQNTSTVDDDNTQGALRFLMHLDAALEGRDTEIRRAVSYGLEGLLKAQYPIGAWPQRFSGPADPATPVLLARFPETWSRTWTRPAYYRFYTFNDNTLRDCIQTLFVAWERYGEERYREAALRAGEFILKAQLPEPQPVWAQQYNLNMEPDWARRFEPPAATGGESSGVMLMLVDLWLTTGDRKWLAPLPAAIAWYERSKLPDGRWARFYELRTNRPLYFVKDTYELTYDDSNLPTHYAFQGTWGQRAIDTCRQMLTADRDQVLAARRPERSPAEWAARARSLAGTATGAAEALDAQGRWVTNGRLDMQTWVRRLEEMASYLDALRRSR